MTDEEDEKAKKTNAQIPAETPKNDIGEGVQLPANSLINRAEDVEQKLQKLVKQDTANLDRREALMVSDRLGGRTEAGQSGQKQFSPEEKAARARIKAIADASNSSWGKKYE